MVRALADQERRSEAIDSSVFAAEAAAIKLHENLEKRRRTVNRLLDELNSINARLSENTQQEEMQLLESIRSLREGIRAATSSSSVAGDAAATPHSIWVSASALVEKTRLQAQSAVTRRELERRALIGLRASAAVEEERTAGEGALQKLKEERMAECSRIAEEYRVKSEHTESVLRAELVGRLEPLLEQAKMSSGALVVSQLRFQVEALEAELSRTTSNTFARTRRNDFDDRVDLYSSGGGDSKFIRDLAHTLQDVSDASTNSDASLMAFSLIDEVLHAVSDVGAAVSLFEQHLAQTQ